MKALNLKTWSTLFVIWCFFFAHIALAQGWKPKLEQQSRDALDTMIKDAPDLQIYKDQAYGYVVYPIITKAGLVVGGAGGEGRVFNKEGDVIGSSKLKQGSFGLQAGGQQYSEVIFFQHKKAFDNFKNGNLKFSGQASAVAIVPGASVDLAYREGVAVFTRVKGGLMAEASLGGQHFSFKPIQ